jgi:hypothetical protein
MIAARAPPVLDKNGQVSFISGIKLTGAAAHTGVN